MNVNEQIAELKGWRPITYQGMGKGKGLWTKWVTPEHSEETVLPDWEHDIAAAWGLVEEIRENWDYGVNLVIYAKTSLWQCGIYDQKGFVQYAGLEITAPAAICAAWLAWKGAK